MIHEFKFIETDIEDLTLIKPFIASDERGFSIKDYSLENFCTNGISYNLKETYYSYSLKGVIRGIHFQRVKQQAKLIRVISGSIFDVVVDLRKNSNTFNQWRGFYLSAENMNELCIPGGCGHGFLALEPSVITNKCAESYYTEYDDGILWNDPTIGIEWPLESINNVILSEKDQNLQTFSAFNKLYGGLD